MLHVLKQHCCHCTTCPYVTAHAGDDKENNGHGALRTASEEKPDKNSHRSANAAESAVARNTSWSKGVWGRGRVTLVGDAAHATINNGEFHAEQDTPERTGLPCNYHSLPEKPWEQHHSASWCIALHGGVHGK